MNDLSVMFPLVVAVLMSLGLAFFDSDDARRELKRLRLVRIAELQNGPAQILGRIVAAEGPVPGHPARAGQVVYVSTVSMGTARHPEPEWTVLSTLEQRFLVDDGSGQALVVVPPPPPQPLPGDDLDYEILCSIMGGARRRSHGMLQAGDQVSIGGYASLTVDPTGNAPSYRGPPTRVMLTATRYYPLLIVKR